jgi:hypothetical protein
VAVLCKQQEHPMNTKQRLSIARENHVDDAVCVPVPRRKLVFEERGALLKRVGSCGNKMARVD